MALLTASLGASAGGGIGGFAGATEFTQIWNNVELVQAEITRVMQYQNQLLQYEAMVRNLTTNPLGVLAPDVARMASNAGRLLTMGKDIGSTMARVDTNFANMFKNPIAASFGAKFDLWTNGSQDALKAAMLNAGLQREQFADDTAAVTALTSKIAGTQGNMEALHALGGINAAQLQESIKLRDLLSQQQIAQNTYLAAQNAKEAASKDASKEVFGQYVKPKASIADYVVK